MEHPGLVIMETQFDMYIREFQYALGMIDGLKNRGISEGTIIPTPIQQALYHVYKVLHMFLFEEHGTRPQAKIVHSSLQELVFDNLCRSQSWVWDPDRVGGSAVVLRHKRQVILETAIKLFQSVYFFLDVGQCVEWHKQMAKANLWEYPYHFAGTLLDFYVKRVFFSAQKRTSLITFLYKLGRFMMEHHKVRIHHKNVQSLNHAERYQWTRAQDEVLSACAAEGDPLLLENVVRPYLSSLENTAEKDKMAGDRTWESTDMCEFLHHIADYCVRKTPRNDENLNIAFFLHGAIGPFRNGINEIILEICGLMAANPYAFSGLFSETKKRTYSNAFDI